MTLARSVMLTLWYMGLDDKWVILMRIRKGLKYFDSFQTSQAVAATYSKPQSKEGPSNPVLASKHTLNAWYEFTLTDLHTSVLLWNVMKFPQERIEYEIGW